MWQIDLSGKTIVVTGGNRGIGLAISHQAAQAGAHVAIIYRQSQDAPEVAKGLAEKYGTHVEAFQCDVSDQKSLQELMRKIYKDIGPVGGVVCNAGVGVKKPALEMTLEDFRAQVEPNLWGVFAAAQAAALLWKEHDYKHGRIVFVSSVSGTIANRGSTQAFYNPSKAAVLSLAKTLSMEWADQGILVNAISPGYVETDMTEDMRADPNTKSTLEDSIMLKRFSKPEEQAAPVLFLLSEQASYVTGAELIVDGGLSAW